jgi:hypothetical protein
MKSVVVAQFLVLCNMDWSNMQVVSSVEGVVSRLV